MTHTGLFVPAWLIVVAAVSPGGQHAADFDDPNALTGWAVKGDVAIDAAQKRSGAASLRIGPGGKGTWVLRKTDDSGKVEMWVREDRVQVKEPKEYRVGPRWGLIQSDGRVLVLAILHARYLAGNRSYNTSDSDQKSTWFDCQYLGITRDDKWHRWTFDFDPKQGLAILRDGKKTRFDWNRTKIGGFCGVALFGDAGKAEPHTLWVDDVSVTLGGPMLAKPVPPPPPPPVTPEKDPAPKEPVQLVEAVRGKHPRLLFTAEDVPELKRRIQGPSKRFYKQLLGYLPSCVPPDHTKFLRNDTDAMRQAFWRLPTVALHYVLTGEKKSLANARGYLAKFLALKNWQEGRERDSGMGAAQLLVGTALAYDWLYGDLDPVFRKKVRDRLLLQTRRMYHGGHLQKNPGAHYWQQDPQNNHRHHRLAGLALGALAVAEDSPDDDWILRKALDELKFVVDWLPDDGSYHDSPSYMIFGCVYLTLACDAADRCFGTEALAHPFFKSNPAFRLHTMLPGLKDSFRFGDGSGLSFFGNYLFKCTAQHRLADEQDGMLRCFRAVPDAFMYGWMSILWFDPTVPEGSLAKVPTARLFEDLGVACIRESWEPDAVAVLFKCGPYGGFKLNQYRNERKGHYINIAHDHPDANSFQLFAAGELLATDDSYPSKAKLTAAHNTLLVDGKGQLGEGKGWTQPLGRTDMTKLGRIVTWKATDDVVLVEGEAAGSYPALTRFRRTLIWVKGAYILVLDDIRAKKKAKLEWLLHSPKFEAHYGGPNTPLRFTLHKGKAACDAYFLPGRGRFGSHERDLSESHGKPIDRGWKLALTADTDAWRLAAVFDPWRRGISWQAKELDAHATTLTITVGREKDVWTWTKAPDASTPATFTCKREGGTTFRVSARDAAPNP